MTLIIQLLLIFCFQLVSTLTNAQTFYEAQFKSGEVLYDMLVIFYDENDVIVRTRYKIGEQYKVAEFMATAKITEAVDGATVYVIRGQTAKLVYGDDGNGYSADNLLFYKDDTGNWGLPYALDNNGWESDDPTSMMTRVAFWRQVDPTETFTDQYVYNYFEKTDPLYKVLLAYNPNNVSEIAGVNAAGSVSGRGEWKVVMSKGTNYGEQSWVTRYTFPETEISTLWDEGKSITDLSYGNGLWFVNLSENSGYGTQAYKYGASWPNKWIDQHFGESRKITEVTYGNGQWAVVMSKESGYSEQKYSVSKDWPKEWLEANWKNDLYSITSLAYGAGHWVVVLSKFADGKNPSQKIRAAAEFPSSEINELWTAGYDISTMAYGDEWVVVLTNELNLIQSYDEGENFPNIFVKEKWNSGYAMTESVYTYTEPASSIVLNFTGTASSNGISNNTIETNNAIASQSAAMEVIAAVPRLHLINVANTIVPDIGVSCAVDRDNVYNEFSDVATGLGIEIFNYTVDGNNLNKDQVTAAINRMDVKPNDIVIFVYSGHGYRWSGQSSQYPQMALFYSRFDSPSTSNSYNLKDVHDMIVAKGARLNIVIGDCCNSDIGVTSRQGGGGLASRTFSQGNVERLRTLFFESRGNIIAAAAQPDETSCGSSISGGYFLNSFFSSLDKEVSYTATGTSSWESILSRTISSATYKTQNLNGCTAQHGIFKKL